MKMFGSEFKIVSHPLEYMFVCENKIRASLCILYEVYYFTIIYYTIRDVFLLNIFSYYTNYYPASQSYLM